MIKSLRRFTPVCSEFVQRLRSVCAAFAQRLRSVCAAFAQCFRIVAQCLRRFCACAKVSVHGLRNVCAKSAQSLRNVCATFAQRLRETGFANSCAQTLRKRVCAAFAQRLRTGQLADERLNPTAANVPRLSLVAAVTAAAAAVSQAAFCFPSLVEGTTWILVKDGAEGASRTQVTNVSKSFDACLLLKLRKQIKF
jgi:hypothetical protein